MTRESPGRSQRTVAPSRRAFLASLGGIGAAVLPSRTTALDLSDPRDPAGSLSDPAQAPGGGSFGALHPPHATALVVAVGADAGGGGVRTRWFGAPNDGNDIGIAINAADRYLGPRPGSICVRPGGGRFATGVILSPYHTLLIGPGVYKNHVNGVLFQVGDHTVVEGEGWNTIITESDHANGVAHPDLLAYCIWRPVSFGSSTIAHNIAIRDMQILGNPNALANGTAATVISGNAHNAIVEGLWLNGTHAIGAQIGAINYGPGQYADAVSVRRCRFSRVGGAQAGVPGGGAVNAGITNAQNSAIEDCVFTIPLGSTVIAIEPNTPEDRVVNCRIARNTIQEMNPAIPVYCISATNTARATVRGNQIVGNIMDGSGATSMTFAVVGIAVAISDTVVSDNVINNCANGIAIVPNIPDAEIVLRVTVRNNKIWATDPPSGIRMAAAHHCTIAGNESDATIGEERDADGKNDADYNLFLDNITPYPVPLTGSHSVAIGTVTPP